LLQLAIFYQFIDSCSSYTDNTPWPSSLTATNILDISDTVDQFAASAYGVIATVCSVS